LHPPTSTGNTSTVLQFSRAWDFGSFYHVTTELLPMLAALPTLSNASQAMTMNVMKVSPMWERWLDFFGEDRVEVRQHVPAASYADGLLVSDAANPLLRGWLHLHLRHRAIARLGVLVPDLVSELCASPLLLFIVRRAQGVRKGSSDLQQMQRMMDAARRDEAFTSFRIADLDTFLAQGLPHALAAVHCATHLVGHHGAGWSNIFVSRGTAARFVLIQHSSGAPFYDEAWMELAFLVGAQMVVLSEEDGQEWPKVRTALTSD
jgi:hypothetical protein